MGGLGQWALAPRLLLMLGIFAAVGLLIVVSLVQSASAGGKADGEASAPEEAADAASAGAAAKGARYAKRTVIWARVLTSVTSLAEGYAQSCVSGAMVLCAEQMALNGTQVAWFQGISYLLMPATMLLSGPLADEIGRVPTVGFSYALLIVGALVMAAAPDYILLLLGRIVEALGLGLGFGAIAIYMPEVSPKDRRGAFCGMEEVLICMGMTLGQVTNCVFSTAAEGWRWTLGFGSFTPAIMLVLILLGRLEESPRYLHLKGRHAEAEKSVRRLLHESEAEEVLRDWQAESDAPPRAQTWAQALNPPPGPKRSAAITGLMVMFMSQFSGVAVISIYMPQVLSSQVGPSRAFEWTVGIFVARTMASLAVACGLVDSVGRRPLLLLSLVGTSGSTFMLAVDYLAEAAPMPWKLGGYICFMMTFALGLGPVPWAYMSEAMETGVRGKGVSVALAFSRLFSWGLLTSFPAASDHIGTGGCWLCLAVLNFTSLGFAWAFVAETMGCSLEHATERFASPHSPR